MISFFKSATDGRHLEELLDIVHECFGQAIRSVCQYATEIDVDKAKEFRLHLGLIEGQWREAKDADSMRAVQASFRGELREYRDHTREQLAWLRKEAGDSTAALASFTGRVPANDGEFGEQFKACLKRLSDMSAGDDLQKVHAAIQAVACDLSTTLHQMRSAHQLTVAQLKDENRVLREGSKAHEMASSTDPLSGAWTRQKLDLRIAEMLGEDERFCMIALVMRNLKDLKLRYSAAMVQGTIRALLMRARGLLGEEALIGRWADDQFVVIQDVESSAVQSVAERLKVKLSRAYSMQEDGIAQEVLVELEAGGIARAAGSDLEDFERKLEELSQTLVRREIP